MRCLLALLTGLAGLSTSQAQDADGRLSAVLPDVYELSVHFDSALSDHGVIHDALIAAETEAMAEMAQLAVSDHAQWMADAPEWSWNPYFSETEIAITFAGRGVISLARTSSYYTGGAHPNQGMAPVVSRSGRYRPVELGELFADPAVDSPAMTALFYAVYRELMAMKRDRLGPDFDERMERETWMAPLAADPEAFPGFTLIPNRTGDAAAGLMFQFEPYAVGSYAEGAYSVPVPLPVFADFLSAEWADVFAGEPDLDVLTLPGDALEPIAGAD